MRTDQYLKNPLLHQAAVEPLPIDPILPQLIARLREQTTLLVTAPPGAGKTTRIPRALHEAGFTRNGEIIILEPRRLAARLAATRVAAELGEKPGATVGYTMRFEMVGSSQTRIRFMTEGILSRRIVQDPYLAGVSIVILDEFHERHLATDLALAYIRQLQLNQRPDLKLLVMSATLEVDHLASFLGGAQVFSGEGSRFDVTIRYEEKASERPLEEKVVRAAVHFLRECPDGDGLVFLPGAAEIRKASEALAPLARRENLLILPLHGDLPPSAQALALEPAERRKLILATNVAETSITIPGVAAVIDSGLARIASHSSWSGLPVLQTGKISKASALQRAGRAGRNRDGMALRLYTRQDFESRREYDLPEVKRADLAETVLTLHGAGIHDARAFRWFEPPSDAALAAAEDLLTRLGALDPQGNLSVMGKRMLRFPIHPRLARMVLEAEPLGIAGEALLLAALISERDIRLQSRSNLGGSASRLITRHTATSDLLEMRDSFREAEKAGNTPGALRSLGLDAGAVERVRRAQAQLTRLLQRGKITPRAAADVDDGLRIAILTAFPDRVAKRRAANSQDLLLSLGGSARLSPDSAVHDAPLMVAVDATERRSQGSSNAGTGVLVRLASAIEPDWLAALFPSEIREGVQLRWNDAGGRVDEIRRTMYAQIALEESIQPARPSEAAGQMLAEAAFARNLSCFPDLEALSALQVRIGLLSTYFPEANFPTVDAPHIRSAIQAICATRRSLSELSRISLCDRISEQLSHRHRELLRREAPERIQLGAHRSAKINYESGKSPWIESRLQDFFGMRSTPVICAGRLQLSIHLLAPNGRAVQVTQDLPGFWKRHYPTVRRELQRRYPKHAWPDPEHL